MNEKEKIFLKAIKAIVKNEITLQMENFKREVSSMITEGRSSNPTDSALSFLYESPATENKTVSKPKRTFVKDSYLNDILNDVGPLNETMSARDMVSYDGFDNTQVITGINGEAINPRNEEVQKVLDLTTRDYSKVLKKIKETTGRI